MSQITEEEIHDAIDRIEEYLLAGDSLALARAKAKADRGKKLGWIVGHTPRFEQVRLNYYKNRKLNPKLNPKGLRR